MEDFEEGIMIPPVREVIVFDDDLQFPSSDFSRQLLYQHDFK